MDKAAFATVGDTGTLADISGMTMEVADGVMMWATGRTGSVTAAYDQAVATAPQPIVVEDASIVRCQNCDHKQPHDYKSGDLCPNCGRQAEPVRACFWCHTASSGNFCRSCGAEKVTNIDYEIAVLLKREGVSKRAIVTELQDMDDAEKETRLMQLRSGKY